MQCVSFIEASLHYQARPIYYLPIPKRKSITLLRLVEPLSVEIFAGKKEKLR